MKRLTRDERLILAEAARICESLEDDYEYYQDYERARQLSSSDYSGVEDDYEYYRDLSLAEENFPEFFDDDFS